MSQRNHVLDGGQDFLWEGLILRGGRPVVKCSDFLPWAM